MEPAERHAGVIAMPYRWNGDGCELQLGTNLGHFTLTGLLAPAPGVRRARSTTPDGLGRRPRPAAREVVMGVERERNEHLGPQLARSLREALTRLREITEPHR